MCKQIEWPSDVQFKVKRSKKQNSCKRRTIPLKSNITLPAAPKHHRDKGKGDTI